MSERTFVVVGSVTRDTPYFHSARGKGITVFAFDGTSGELTRLSEVNTLLIGLGLSPAMVEAALGALILALVSIYGREPHVRASI